MACVVMAITVLAQVCGAHTVSTRKDRAYSYDLYGYGLYCCGLCSYGPYNYGLERCGQYSYDLYGYCALSVHLVHMCLLPIWFWPTQLLC